MPIQLKQVSSSLSSIFNTLGNTWIVENFELEPFNFTVFVRQTGHDEEHLGKYIAEIYTDRFVPRNLKLSKKHRKKGKDYVPYTTIEKKFKELSKYLDIKDGIEMKLMELDYRN